MVNTPLGLRDLLAKFPPAIWSPPPATDDQFRAAGYTAKARGFPLSEAGARWVAAWNGIEFEKIPASWCYAPNVFMQQWVEEKA